MFQENQEKGSYEEDVFEEEIEEEWSSL